MPPRKRAAAAPRKTAKRAPARKTAAPAAAAKKATPRKRAAKKTTPAKPPLGPIAAATERSLKAAELGDVDAGAVEVLRKLATAADSIDENGLNPAGKLDNVTIPTYRAYAESLGLTPAGRAKLAEGKKPEGKPGGKLASVSNIPRPA